MNTVGGVGGEAEVVARARMEVATPADLRWLRLAREEVSRYGLERPAII